MTELPKALFRKPKRRNYSVGSDTEDGEKLFKPVFSKRNADKQIRPLGNGTFYYLNISFLVIDSTFCPNAAIIMWLYVTKPTKLIIALG